MATHVTQAEYDRIWQERMDDLDQMPGGAQGAHPDMRDLCTDDLGCEHILRAALAKPARRGQR